MFSTVLKIAVNSLKRRLNRTLLVIIMITVCFWSMLVMQGVYDGMTEQIITNAIRSSSGHISLFAPDYREQKGLEHSITNLSEIVREIQEEKLARNYTYRIIQDCLIATAHYSQNATVYGVDLDLEKGHGRLDEFIISGSYSFLKHNKGVLLGTKLAKKLKTSIGKKVIISAQSSTGEIASVAMKVSGILKTNTLAIDETAIFFDYSKLSDLLQAHDMASQISLLFEDDTTVDEKKNHLSQKYHTLAVFSWGELYPALLQSKTMMKIFNLVTSGIVFFVAGLGIFGVMLVSVLERMRELGILIAIGTRFHQITLMILIESLSMSFLGYILGAIFGTATLWYFIVAGLDLTFFSEGFDAFGIDTVIYATIKKSYYATAFASIFLASFSSIIYPLWIVKKTNPIETIKAL